MEPVLSVVVVNYNAGSLLVDCIRSVIGCADQVVVVDNASSDGSLANLTVQMSNEPKVKIIENAENEGFSVGCNIGFRTTVAPYVLFLNPDCVLGDTAAVKMIECLESDTRIGMVGGLLINSDGTEQAGGRRAVPTPWRSFVRAFGLHKFALRWPRLFFDFCLHESPLPKNPVDVEAISGACMMVQREAFNDVGLWDEAYFLHCEDLDLCIRFRQNGWRIMFVPSSITSHALGACGRGRPLIVEWHKHKGMMRFYRKFFQHQYPGLLMWFVFIGVWIRYMLIVGMVVGKRIMKTSDA